jgi:SAM-dependent methyltransferase
LLEAGSAARRLTNADYTGDPDVSWLMHLIGGGGYRDAAALGCCEADYESIWIRAGASERLDVYDLSDDVLRTVRHRLREGPFAVPDGAEERVHFVQADLNFVRLPSDHYDVMWTSGCMHHVANLERLFEQVSASLRDGGLFALHDYVGERRLQYSATRLELVNDALRRIPLRFRKWGLESIERPPLDELSPFCGVRSHEILAAARAQFEVVHEGFSGALFPLGLMLDFEAMEHEAPELIAAFVASEAAARKVVAPAGAYAVYRKRAT